MKMKDKERSLGMEFDMIISFNLEEANEKLLLEGLVSSRSLH